MWWKQKVNDPSARAVAYYRHSAQDRQENSIPLQREQVRSFALTNQIDIIAEFEDAGRSGLTAEGRPGFNSMLEFVRTRQDFQMVLVLDVSRWGRFQDTDLSAKYSAECKNYGKEVVYTNLGVTNDGSPIYSLMVNFERWRSAQYSRELSDKVFKGCREIARQGYRAGGPAPYALERVLLDEKRQFVQVLEPGQHKSIQNQRVTLRPGPENEQSVVRKIFHDFALKGRNTHQIAKLLNNQGVPSPGGGRWSSGAIHSILTNELYIGTMIYNKTSQRLKGPSTHNPKDEWVRTQQAFNPVVDPELFAKAKMRLDKEYHDNKQKYSREGMLTALSQIYDHYGMISTSLVTANKSTPSTATYRSRFGSLDFACEYLFQTAREAALSDVHLMIEQLGSSLETYDDYLVIDQNFSVLIQPSIPLRRGFGQYWPFHVDPRDEVDFTLGVPLSANDDVEILGYLVFPRLFMRGRHIQVSEFSEGALDLFGYSGIGMIAEMIGRNEK